MGNLPNLANLDYLARVNRAIDFVTQHLAEPLKLDEVAKVACFSPYHFHRIFRSITGETLHDFVKRVRLDRALHLMAHAERLDLTEVALACGFSSSSDFSRSFRQRFGVPPSAYDLEKHRDENRGKLDALHAAVGRLPEGMNPDNFEIAIRELPARRVAYLRAFRPYEGGGVEAFKKMLEWAKRRGVAGGMARLSMGRSGDRAARADPLRRRPRSSGVARAR